MKSALTAHDAGRAVLADRDHRRPLRLRLKPKARATGQVDGAWWPRSHDLAGELPDLLAVLSARLGPVERVNYNMNDWLSVPRKIAADHGVVRVAGYRSQHPDTVDVVAARQRLTLLVVPSESAPDAAHEALLRAGRPDNADPVEQLLAPSIDAHSLIDTAHGRTPVAEQQWESEGGHLRDRDGRRAGLRVRSTGPSRSFTAHDESDRGGS
ncbi:MAG TPA: DUF5994 family protein [Kutzneria sp.]|nr:DUF5994 family protein [Kutzneria sp.]